MPVPRDLVDEVRVFIFHLSLQGTPNAWNMDSLGGHWASLDDDAKRMLVVVARAMLRGAPISTTDVAEALGINLRETYGLVHMTNEVEGDNPRPSLVWTLPPGLGEVTGEPALSMTEPVAEMIVGFEEGDLPVPARSS